MKQIGLVAGTGALALLTGCSGYDVDGATRKSALYAEILRTVEAVAETVPSTTFRGWDASDAICQLVSVVSLDQMLTDLNDPKIVNRFVYMSAESWDITVRVAGRHMTLQVAIKPDPQGCVAGLVDNFVM